MDDLIRRVVQEQMPETLGMLREYCSKPSVAAKGEGIEEAAGLVRQFFEDLGASPKILRLEGAHPVVYAEFPGASQKTLLFYNHYDVQPPEPLEEWASPPFELVERDGRLFARGVADNKGDLVSRLAAIKALLTTHGQLPCRVKFLVEGEEEIGSVSFPRYIHEYRDLFMADACIWEYGERDHKERFHIVAGVKGICYVQLEIENLRTDLHSSLGAILEGAPMRLVWALAGLKGQDGRINVPGFYDRVKKPGDAELEAAKAIPFDEEEIKQYVGARSFIGGKQGFDALYDLLFSPTCTICGLEGGYTGPGSKTVLPRKAMAKVDFRLVPDQDPEEIADLLRRHLDAQGFSDITVTLMGGEKAYRTDLRHPFVRLVMDVAREVTGREVVLYPNSAGTGPMHPVGMALGVPIVSIGCGYWDSRVHAPNEHIRRKDLEETILLMARLIERFAV
ncbi:MAG: M20/M25/M40 family metallo-hydrolase [Armatimonadota bacterium]|nr:M20/M25/M40 family metallo-hydrolase [Armatimonadota bacterium]MDR5704401.1 M20/M25/M40 family metallo-hydrolase [Armatimonadota bacterium]